MNSSPTKATSAPDSRSKRKGWAIWKAQHLPSMYEDLASVSIVGESEVRLERWLLIKSMYLLFLMIRRTQVKHQKNSLELHLLRHLHSHANTCMLIHLRTDRIPTQD